MSHELQCFSCMIKSIPLFLEEDPLEGFEKALQMVYLAEGLIIENDFINKCIKELREELENKKDIDEVLGLVESIMIVYGKWYLDGFRKSLYNNNKVIEKKGYRMKIKDHHEFPLKVKSFKLNEDRY